MNPLQVGRIDELLFSWQVVSRAQPDKKAIISRKLAYHGRIDDNWEDESKVTKQELKEAIEALAAGKPAPKQQRPSMGCSIKWL